MLQTDEQGHCYNVDLVARNKVYLDRLTVKSMQSIQ